MQSNGETTFEYYWELLHKQFLGWTVGIEAQVRFAPPRKWRADFVVGKRVIVEIDGGVYSGGRHTTGAGFTKDCEKLNAAAELGYSVLRFTTEMLSNDPQACIEQVVNTYLATAAQ